MRTQIKRLSNTEIKWTALLFYHYMVLQTQWHSTITSCKNMTRYLRSDHLSYFLNKKHAAIENEMKIVSRGNSLAFSILKFTLSRKCSKFCSGVAIYIFLATALSYRTGEV